MFRFCFLTFNPFSCNPLTKLSRVILLSFSIFPFILLSFYPFILLCFYASMLLSFYPSILPFIHAAGSYPSIRISFYVRILLSFYLFYHILYPYIYSYLSIFPFIHLPLLAIQLSILSSTFTSYTAFYSIIYLY